MQCRCPGRCLGKNHDRESDAVAEDLIPRQVWRTRMKHSLSRAVIALGIAMSLWLTSVAAVAAPRRAQDQNTSSSQQKDKDKNAKQQPATTQTARTKPLSTNEDPTMIG